MKTFETLLLLILFNAFRDDSERFFPPFITLIFLSLRFFRYLLCLLFITSTIFIHNDTLFAQQKEIIKRLYSKNKSKRYFHPFSPEFKLLKRKAYEEFNFIDDQEIKKQLVSLFMQQSCNKD